MLQLIDNIQLACCIIYACSMSLQKETESN